LHELKKKRLDGMFPKSILRRPMIKLIGIFAVGYEDERLFTKMGEMDRANCVGGG
jgi:hypothetical protein